MAECPCDNYTYFERHEREQERQRRVLCIDWDEEGDDKCNNLDDEEFE